MISNGVLTTLAVTAVSVIVAVPRCSTGVAIKLTGIAQQAAAVADALSLFVVGVCVCFLCFSQCEGIGAEAGAAFADCVQYVKHIAPPRFRQTKAITNRVTKVEFFRKSLIQRYITIKAAPIV